MTAETIRTDRSEKPRHRGGRPPAERAGEVERRILKAATELFLGQGFDATNCDQIAALAGAGKASIYARYANKEELFAAVVQDNVDRTLASSAEIPPHLPLDARLLAVGQSILSHALRPEAVALVRVVMTTAHRMPGLVRLADRIGKEDGTARVAAAIVGDRDAPPDAIARALPLAARFVDLVLAPQQMRALMGDDPAKLRAAAPSRIREALDLLAGSGWLKDWK